MKITDNINAILKSVKPLRRAFENSFNEEGMRRLFHVAANENRSLDEIASFLSISLNLLEVLASDEAGQCFLHCARKEFQKQGIPECFVIPDDFRSE